MIALSSVLTLALVAQAGDAATTETAADDLGRGRFSLTYGASLRSSSLAATAAPGVSVGGFSPSALRFQGQYLFGRSPFGVAADVAGDWYVARQTGCAAACATVPLAGVRAWGAAAARWSPVEHLSGELTVGYGYGAVPTITAASGTPAATAATHHGPIAGLTVGFDSALFEARASVRAMPRALGASVAPLGGVGLTQWALGLELGAGGLVALSTRWAAVASYEFESTTASGALALDQQTHRFGIGVRMLLEAPSVEGAPVVPPPALVHGHLVRIDAQGARPAAGATVRVGASEAITDALGAFRVEVTTFGPLEVSVAAADGYPAASAQLTVTPGGDHEVELQSRRPSGPGSIRGRLTTPTKGAKVAVPGGTVRRPGQEPISCGDDGTFLIAQAGPGPVAIAVSAPGFVTREEVISVPPEQEVAVELELVPEKARLPAVIRGFVRTASGKLPAAWVEVVETKQRQRVGSGGAFSVLVPGGRYTVRFEAEGFVTQTHQVQVADGDQSIFHIDLQPVQR
ncbi:MAG: carboxypeptidase regulatory-like domain-containing protein [Myxococcaceae bacterium]|nr:carboxypeptidase regulatory-like domain-containing protein [Myxococcaceae bacterium]